MCSRNRNPRAMHHLTLTFTRIALLLSSTSHLSSSLRVFYSDQPNIASNKEKNDPTSMASSSFLWRSPFAQNKLLSSSNLHTTLNNPQDMSIWSDVRQNLEPNRMKTKFSFHDVDAKNRIPSVELNKQSDLKLTENQFLDNNSGKWLSKLMIMKKKAQEIIRALRRRDWKTTDASRKKDQFSDFSYPELIKETVPEPERIDELEKDENDKVINSWHTKVDVPGSFNYYDEGFVPESRLSSPGNRDTNSDFWDTGMLSNENRVKSFIWSDRPKLHTPEVQWFPHHERQWSQLPATSSDELRPHSSHNDEQRDESNRIDGSNTDSGFSVFLNDPVFPGEFLDVPVDTFQPLAQTHDFQSELDKPSPFFDEVKASTQFQQRDTHDLDLWDSGSFEQGDKDCETISTKSCLTDRDCSCHGFYKCSLGRCSLLGNHSKNTASGTWYDQPFDIGSIEEENGDNNELGSEIKSSVAV